MDSSGQIILIVYEKISEVDSASWSVASEETSWGSQAKLTKLYFKVEVYLVFDVNDKPNQNIYWDMKKNWANRANVEIL